MIRGARISKPESAHSRASRPAPLRPSRAASWATPLLGLALILLHSCADAPVGDAAYPVASLDASLAETSLQQEEKKPEEKSAAEKPPAPFINEPEPSASAASPESADPSVPSVRNSSEQDSSEDTGRGLHGFEGGNYTLFKLPELLAEEPKPPARPAHKNLEELDARPAPHFPPSEPEPEPAVAEPEPPAKPEPPPVIAKPEPPKPVAKPAPPPVAKSESSASSAQNSSDSAAAAKPAPKKPSLPKEGSPPPLPPNIRPAEPAPPPDPPYEAPEVAIPELPAAAHPLQSETPAYSRTVAAHIGQLVEIPFRGPGWVYLGELGSRRGVYYDSRRLDAEGMSFIFRADDEGTYSLKFNRQDFLRDIVINDYVKVVVEQPPEFTGGAWNAVAASPDRVTALPRWPLPAEPAAQQPAAQTPPPASIPEPSASTETSASSAPQPAAPAPSDNSASPARNSSEPSLPEDYLKLAKEQYDAGNIGASLSALDQFRAAYPGGSDEAYWLYAQALEANGPNRDIRLALDYYKRLVNEYPQSLRYDAAQRRIAYLEKFYFNIR
jgi:hypothetical protein